MPPPSILSARSRGDSRGVPHPSGKIRGRCLFPFRIVPIIAVVVLPSAARPAPSRCARIAAASKVRRPTARSASRLRWSWRHGNPETRPRLVPRWAPSWGRLPQAPLTAKVGPVAGVSLSPWSSSSYCSQRWHYGPHTAPCYWRGSSPRRHPVRKRGSGPCGHAALRSVGSHARRGRYPGLRVPVGPDRGQDPPEARRAFPG